MIASKRDLHFYLAADLAAHSLEKFRPWSRFKHPIVHFQRLLRRTEYWENCGRGPLATAQVLMLRWRLSRRGQRLGFSIPRNVFGPGLGIAHYGTIVINENVRIGRNCRIHVDVNIGQLRGQNPTIGDNCYIAPGAKIFGGVVIGSGVAVGANAVVTRDVPDGATVVGIPARVVSTSGSEGLIRDACALASRSSG